MAEPQITEIAADFVTRLPDEGGDPAVAREGWRRALRLARELGDVGWVAKLVSHRAPDDATLRAHCEALRS